MKNGYAYIRISDEDQSHFSLSGQENVIVKFGEQHHIHIEKFYVDECSAKDFSRPKWKMLEEDLYKNKDRVDYLIVMKYDRLIRNALEGLSFIEKLEKKWDVKLLSVMENFFIDPHSPYFFKMRADLLVTADFERRVIADRTKFGNWSAKDSGRFIGPAPFGYINQRDEEDKPIIVVNEAEKPMVQQIFQDYIAGLSFPAILRRAREKGFNLKGHDALYRILSNHVYAGLILVPEYKEHKSSIKKGQHEAIIPEHLFWQAYYKLQESIKPQVLKTFDDNLPLRGLITCRQCGRAHTGARSKGRSAYYYYYNCNKCNKEIYNVNQAHEELKETLTKLSLKQTAIEALIKEADIELEKSLSERKATISKLKRECSELDTKIKGLEQKYIEDKINDATYKRWFDLFNKERNEKISKLQVLERNDDYTRSRYKEHLPYLGDLNWLYEKAEITDKQALLKGIFLGGLIKEKPGYRTAFLNPIFSQNASDIKVLGELTLKGKPAFKAGFPESTQDGT